MTILKDNSIKLGTARRSDNKVGRLRVEWNTMRNSVGFSGQTQAGEWVNAYLMLSEFITMCDDIKILLNAKEENFFDCSVDEKNQAAYRIGVGRDADGVLYLEMAAPNKEPLRYLYLPERQYHRTRNGQPLSPNELSRRRASAWVQIAVPAMIKLAGADEETATEGQGGFQKKPYQNNGGQGGYQKKPWQGNGGQGGYQKKPWQGNGGGQGGYQKKNWEQPQQQQAPVSDGSLDDYLTI